MSVISVRVPEESKKTDMLKYSINWSEEIRKFITGKIREYKRVKVVKRVEKLIRTLPEAPRGTITSLIGGIAILTSSPP